jgi:hypothetical protein
MLSRGLAALVLAALALVASGIGALRTAGPAGTPSRSASSPPIRPGRSPRSCGRPTRKTTRGSGPGSPYTACSRSGSPLVLANAAGSKRAPEPGSVSGAVRMSPTTRPPPRQRAYPRCNPHNPGAGAKLCGSARGKSPCIYEGSVGSHQFPIVNHLPAFNTLRAITTRPEARSRGSSNRSMRVCGTPAQ